MYKAIIDIRIEVHQEEEGKCLGNIIPDVELSNYGIKNNLLISISGATKNDCLTKLKEWINEYR